MFPEFARRNEYRIGFAIWRAGLDVFVLFKASSLVQCRALIVLVAHLEFGTDHFSGALVDVIGRARIRGTRVVFGTYSDPVALGGPDVRSGNAKTGEQYRCHRY